MGSKDTNAKVAIVTGGARGIGRAIVSSFACRGIVSVIADIDFAAAEKAVDEVRKSGGEAFAVQADFSQTSQIKHLIETTIKQFGRLDILVNNAGILTNTSYSEVTEEEWDRVLDINLKGVFFTTREAIKPMISQGWGRIISISSMAGRSGGVSAGSAYVASKAALIGLTRHLAKKVARNGITVNAVAPGTIETDMLKTFTETEMATLYDTILVGRLGKPEEIAETVAFLASDSAAYITGTVIDVNGGNYMA